MNSAIAVLIIACILFLADPSSAQPIRHDIEAVVGVFNVQVIDMNQDGFNDVLASVFNENYIAWWENLDGTGTSWDKHYVVQGLTYANGTQAADIDGDGDVDVVGVGWLGSDKIAWWENANGSGTSWTEHVVKSGFPGAKCICVIDLDQDGDLDIIGGADTGDQIAWWENLNGVGTSWAEEVVASSVEGVYRVDAVDLNGDDTLDIVAAYGGWNPSGWVTWFEAPNWTSHIIATPFQWARSAYGYDIDGDLDCDVVGAAFTGDKVTWWENDGSGGTWTEHMVQDPAIGACEVRAFDFDFDGDLDLVGALAGEVGGGGTGIDVAWWENADGVGSSWITHEIDSSFEKASAINVGYINTDSSIDVLSGQHNPYAGLAWWDLNLTGIETEEGSEGIPVLLGLSVTPNPSVGTPMLSIELTANCDVSVSVFDIRGHLVYSNEANLPSGLSSIGISVMQSGCYICRISAVSHVECLRFLVL